MIESLPPGLVLVLGALLVPLLRGRLRQALLLSLPVLGFVQLWLLPEGLIRSVDFFGYPLVAVRVDALSKAFGYVFYIAALLNTIYALHLKDGLQHVSALVYSGAAIAAVFVGDLISLFVYWELTSIASVFLIWARRTERSSRAGMRFLLVQVSSGVLLLAGAILHFTETGSLAFDHLGLVSLGTGLILVSFGIKAAFPLLHNWLQDAYPEATVTGTVVLSAFTTKLAIYALARGFAGTEILIPIGATMTAFPIFYAVIENDLRRVLSYSLNNQVGFMVVGVGIGTEMAIDGAVAHVFAHVIYKALLFMSMGAVLLRTGTIKATKLGGLYKSMPWTTCFCVVGAASISAFPLFSGFVSKSLILTAAADEHHTITFLVLLFASAGVFHHSGIKIPYFAFFAHDRGLRVKEAPLNMLLAMAAASALCIGIGVYPDPLYRLLPFTVSYDPYTTTHVVTTLQLLFFSALAFTVLMLTGLYPPERESINLDFDWTYRHALPALGSFLTRTAGAHSAALKEAGRRVLGRALERFTQLHTPPNILGEPWPPGPTAMWAALLLAAYLLLYFL